MGVGRGRGRGRGMRMVKRLVGIIIMIRIMRVIALYYLSIHPSTCLSIYCALVKASSLSSLYLLCSTSVTNNTVGRHFPGNKSSIARPFNLEAISRAKQSRGQSDRGNQIQ
ncbi:hypothetical protein BKA65DRAFT_518704 [Rhexocercosporidium sp. MPI-PUGE-AT-0058]|nr:hypothetical protein BKA65DRAFT_518704 [Rhexocercosporidium sp. MPI-PUGE-AT-0058]